MTTPAAGRVPLVSCVMPTADRRAFVPQAIRYFRRQDYPNKELVVVDDGADPVEDLVPTDPQVRYVRLTGRRTLGAKRNACVEVCRGELVMHWDDDDWMAPHRITYQVAALVRSGAEVCGSSRLLFYDPVRGHTWLYDYAPDGRPWIAGGTLLYTKTFWRRAPFPDIQVGSDTVFVWNQPLDTAAFLPDYRYYVAVIHPGNTSPKLLSHALWTRWEANVEHLIGDDMPFYHALGTAPEAQR
ncbi:MAG TPA: glycosyltransferase family 2 protein [Gemmataceae bacterium]|nr:glycosyltransferase family 2 protein [Gemmataceae bacterium]